MKGRNKQGQKHVANMVDSEVEAEPKKENPLPGDLNNRIHDMIQQELSKLAKGKG